MTPEGWLLAMFLLCVYLLPTIKAYVREVPDSGRVAMVNVFLGWTVYGWLKALAMAEQVAPPPRRPFG